MGRRAYLAIQSTTSFMLDRATLIVFLYATLTAVTTGLGALPFLFVKQMPSYWLGWAGGIASGIMLAASFQLIEEGIDHEVYRTLIGVILGLLFILLSQRWLSRRNTQPSIGELRGASASKALLILGVMTLHSLAEGIGVGVSFGDGERFGAYISWAIAVHNIPEGLAISLVLVPKGESVWRAVWFSIFSSLPQPLLAVPSYWFVEAFRPFLPVGLGLAAGAMIWMVVSELLPDAYAKTPKEQVATLTTLAAGAMILFQHWLG
jgi:zinc transporter, ZIP family